MIFKQYKNYPKCGAFIQNYLCLIDIFSPKVFGAFIEVCESEDLARQAITLGKFPEITIAKFVKHGKEQRNVGGMYSGECDPTQKNIVFINRHIARGYEDFSSNWELFERIILHEMVHWARFVGGKPGKANGTREAGNLFEEKGYGVVAGDHDDAACA